jgi:hypothetical protein
LVVVVVVVVDEEIRSSNGMLSNGNTVRFTPRKNDNALVLEI